MMRVVKFVARRGEAAGGDAGPEDQRVGRGGGDGAAVGGGAGARGRGADIERVDRIQAAVLQGADVDVGGGGVEGDGHGVGSGGGGLDVGGVVDRLADPGAPGGGHRQLVGVAGRVGDRGDIRGRVVPADGQDVGVPGGLRAGVGDRAPTTDWSAVSPPSPAQKPAETRRRRSGCGRWIDVVCHRRRQCGVVGHHTVDGLAALGGGRADGRCLVDERLLILAARPGQHRPQRRRVDRG